eukprot:TRINITY_DN2413_c0_g1_i1.p1 TRINITY_DN2413_c0_g1~~TRINITY_DN2413_c0_g1_i1.p1  ORF type:complete len:495 (-),score=241.77 TRINITY_DN2413_c0_g1_i1:134-1618(-)
MSDNQNPPLSPKSDPDNDEDLQPPKKEDRSNLLKVIGKAIGIDVTTIAIPVTYNEPTSFLQRMMEYLTYYELLEKANKFDDADYRTLYVALFAISSYSTTEKTNKPFNPLLGETYEYVDPNKNFRFFAEQVSHHPPIGAAIAECPSFDYWQDQMIKTKFQGNSLDVTPLGSTNVRLKAWDETYYWDYAKLKTVAHNLILGKVWIDNYGEITVTCREDERYAEIKFKQCGWFSKGWHEVEGTVYTNDGKPRFKLHGKWNDRMYVTLLDNADLDKKTQKALHKMVKNDIKEEKKKEKELKKKEKKEKKHKGEDHSESSSEPSTPRESRDVHVDASQVEEVPTDEPIEDSSDDQVTDQFELGKPKLAWKHKYRPTNKDPYKKWEMTEFGIKLLELTEEMKQYLPPSDSRLRKDRLALEHGEIKKAKDEKHRLEEAQRERKKQRDASNIAYKPKYFEKRKHAGKTQYEYWAYCGSYWEERDERLTAMKNGTVTNNNSN